MHLDDRQSLSSNGSSPVFPGPVILKLAAYYGIAPFFNVRPIRFTGGSLPSPVIQDSGVSVTLGLKGEKAWIKESYLQASDEQLDRQTRFVLNWQIPVTCSLLPVELVEFASRRMLRMDRLQYRLRTSRMWSLAC